MAYLLRMAWSTWRDREALVLGAPAADPAGDGIPAGGGTPAAWRVIGQGVLVNPLNPKLTIFFFAFLPQFVTAGQAGATLRMVELSGVLMAVTFVVFAAYGVFAVLAGRLAVGEG